MDCTTGISLFSGAGGLDLGIKLAFPGIRWLCHIEREAYAAGIIAARMEDETMDAAPVWSDVSTFDGKPFHGRVDILAGGFPCTDLSVAGKRAGINGSASGLWWEYARIIREVQPRRVFIENVPPVLFAESARAVFGELSRLGFDAEWLSLRASDVGASHQRKRVFILAYSRHNAGSTEQWKQYKKRGKVTGGAGEKDVAYHPGERLREAGPSFKRPKERIGGINTKLADSVMEHTEGRHGRSQQPAAESATDGRSGSTGASERLEPCQFCGYEFDQSFTGKYGCPNCEGEGLADASQQGSQGDEQPGSSGQRDGSEASGSVTEFCGTLPTFPPGPADTDAWRRILAEYPELAPALSEEEVESGVCRSLDGLAHALDERTNRLRATGNGVVALQAAVAFTILARRIKSEEIPPKN